MRPNVLHIPVDYQKWLMLTGISYLGFIIIFYLLDFSFCFIILLLYFLEIPV